MTYSTDLLQKKTRSKKKLSFFLFCLGFFRLFCLCSFVFFCAGTSSPVGPLEGTRARLPVARTENFSVRPSPEHGEAIAKA